MECIGFDAALYSLLPQHQPKKRASQGAHLEILPLQKRMKLTDQGMRGAMIVNSHANNSVSLQERMGQGADDHTFVQPMNSHANEWMPQQTHIGNHDLGYSQW
jgi:hypothetical protein